MRGLRGSEAEVLNELGTLHLACGDIDQAEVCHRQTLDLAGEIASPHDQAHVLAGLARCSLTAGRGVEAEDSLWQAQEIYQRIGAAEASAVSAELDALRNAPSPTPVGPQGLTATRERRHCSQEGTPTLRVLTRQVTAGLGEVMLLVA